MPKTVLILEKTPLVSLDLFEIVTDAAPDAAIYVVRNLNDAVRALDAFGAFDLAFIGSTKDDPDGATALHRFAGKVRRVVLTDDAKRAAETPEAGWFVVPRPFAPRNIHEHITAVCEAVLRPEALRQC